MKIHILSDLHMEFAEYEPDEMLRHREISSFEFDVLVLAGDIGKHTHGLEWARKHNVFTWGLRPIIYVPGNHEFYGAEIFGIREQLQRCADDARERGIPIYVLDDESVEIDGVRFLGSTLWTDYQLFGKGAEMGFAMRQASHFLNDHSVIRCAPQSRFTPSQALSLHNDSVTWLSAELAKPHSGKTVVVTHHLPSAQSVAERYKKEPLSAAFASNLDHLVKKADLWVHGHTHDNFDYQLGKCRVVCNPRGYVRERYEGRQIENKNFNPELVVEIL